MREDDSFQIRGSELKEKLSLMGYEIDPGLIRYIPIGNQGYCRREGMLKDGKVEEVWYYNLQEVVQFLDDLAAFKLTDKLRERGYEIEPGWVKYFPREFTDGKFCYDLEKVIAFLNSTTQCNLQAKLKELGYDIDDNYLDFLSLHCPDYSSFKEKGFSTIDLERAIVCVNSVNNYNLPEKLKELGYEVDDQCIRHIKDHFGLTDFVKGQSVYNMEKVITYIKRNPPREMNIQTKIDNPTGSDGSQNNFFGNSMKDFYGGANNLYSRFPISKWYAEKYNTVPDVCFIGRIYIDDLLENEDFKIRWTFKNFTDYDGEDRLWPDMLRVFEREQMCECITEALIEIEDGMFLLLCDGILAQKDMSMQATAILFYKEGIHDPTEVLLFVSDKHVQHNESGTLGLLYHGPGGFNTQEFTIPNPVIDFELNYNSGFRKIHDTIYLALALDKGKGLVLLHGKPGTGKTTYIRYLINVLNKNKIFVPPNLTEMLSDPGFIPFLMDNPNCVLFVEDAENVLLSREDGQNNQAVSNILNITDGLLSDCLNIQIVATFNTHIKNIDEALLRKGRLITQYEFKPLEPERAEKLANSLHVWLDDTENLTLADIYASQVKKT